jgi:hypothetical protein
MGYYIKTPDNLDKDLQILKLPGAKREDESFFDPTGERIGVCVVCNGAFEAAWIMYNKAEADYFAADESSRRKHWLSIPREIVIELNPHVEEVLTPLQKPTEKK